MAALTYPRLLTTAETVEMLTPRSRAIWLMVAMWRARSRNDSRLIALSFTRNGYAVSKLGRLMPDEQVPVYPPGLCLFLGHLHKLLDNTMRPELLPVESFRESSGAFPSGKRFPTISGTWGENVREYFGRAYASSQNPKQACFVSRLFHASAGLPRFVPGWHGLGRSDRHHLRRHTRFQRRGRPWSPDVRP